ncbi:MAG: DUF47 family protein [Lentisphaerae bacterium]|nr:DUF47 family protein [Lentisphaerota bacterium]
MLRFLFRKERQVEQFIFSYIDYLGEARERFAKAMEVYLRDGLCDNFRFLAEQTHKAESKADDVRYAVESMMYEQALLPESRGDILGLLEAVDAVPGIFDRTLYTIDNRRIQVPEFLIAELREMVQVSVEAVEAFEKQLRGLFTAHEDVRPLIQLINRNESQVDHIERNVMRQLFDSPIDPFAKIQTKDLLVELADISDLAHQLSRRVYIISVKRRV